MVNILAWRSGSVGSNPSQKRRVIMDDAEKQLKCAIKIDEVASISKENWDEDQEASHHLLVKRICAWLKECDGSLTLKSKPRDRRRKRANQLADLCNQKTVDLRTS